MAQRRRRNYEACCFDAHIRNGFDACGVRRASCSASPTIVKTLRYKRGMGAEARVLVPIPKKENTNGN